MTKKKLMSVFLAVIILVLPLSSCANKETWFEFRYQSKSDDNTSEMYYDDSLFDKPSYVYDPSLATASLSFAMASFAAVAESYPTKSKHAIDLLERLGYSDADANIYYEQKPGTDTVGCVFAHKKIGNIQMIACGIRGSNYESEWASNMTVGTNEHYHQGFFEGSELFLTSLKDYITDNGISGNIGLWIVGYSRAGAICNLASGRLDEALNNGKCSAFLGDDVTLSKDKLYAYCFEAPKGVKYDESLYPKSEIFNNIFCIVNHNDAIPMVMMDYFGFTRYGVEKVLFDNMNDMDYEKDIKVVKDLFDKYENSDILGEYVISKFEMKRLSGLKAKGSEEYFNWSQGIFLDDFISHLAQYGVQNLDVYLDQLEEGFSDIFSFVYSKSTTSASFVDLGLSIARDTVFSLSADLLFDDLLYNQSKITKDFKITLMKALEALNVNIDVDSIVKAVEGLLSAITRSLIHDFEFGMLVPLLSKNNISGIAQAHQPETTLAFLRALDPKYNRKAVDYDMSGRYYYVEIEDTSADVTVTCKGKEIARFENGKPQKTDSFVPYGRHRKLRIYLPYDGEYEIVSSSDKISVTLYEPSRIGYSDCEFEILTTDNTYSVTIAK